jgi:hypothetical protein
LEEKHIRVRYSSVQQMEDNHKFITTFNVTKCCSSLLIKLIRRMVLKKLFPSICTLLYISFAAKGQQKGGQNSVTVFIYLRAYSTVQRPIIKYARAKKQKKHIRGTYKHATK